MQAAAKTSRKDPGPLHKFKFFRVILDESHMVKNRRSRRSIGAAGLSCQYRWALSGTPVQVLLASICARATLF